MRIGVNALYLIPGGVGGTEIYLRRLLAALAHIDRDNEYFVFTNRETEDLTPPAANFHARPQPVRARFRPARILYEQLVLPFAAARCDVLLNPGFTAPLITACPAVTVFHDLQHKRHPEHFRWFDLPFWRVLLWASAHRAKRIIAVSEATRADLRRFYHLPEQRIAVVHHGVETEFFSLQRKPENFVLCVSTLHPHKNLDRLVRAYASKPRDFTLVIAGMRGFFAQQLDALIAQLGVADRVRLTGWIPRAELLQLFARARAFVYPSTFEGFGMPVLEALAAGLPVACSNIAPLKEVAGDTALYFDPASEAEIGAALDRIVEEDGGRGVERARGFGWERCAQETLVQMLVAANLVDV